MSSDDPFSRILGSFEVSGKKHYKIYFIVDQELFDKLVYLTDIFGGIDEALEKAVNIAIEQVSGVLPSEKEKVEGKLTEKEISELKDMIKRLEARIRDIVSSMLSSATPIVQTVETPTSARRGKRRANIDLEDIPDLVEAEESESESVEETGPSLSLEDAIAQAIVVAIDEELSNVLSVDEGEESSTESSEGSSKNGSDQK